MDRISDNFVFRHELRRLIVRQSARILAKYRSGDDVDFLGVHFIGFCMGSGIVSRDLAQQIFKKLKACAVHTGIHSRFQTASLLSDLLSCYSSRK
ncbi:hypothetical protein CXF95_28195 [Paraglaciecola sp. MB-3u-78]|nr:hypothetical protein CXF95_28195 [Paraglaciecola sp. MB-3u-78]